jgi:hypothetical protein
LKTEESIGSSSVTDNFVHLFQHEVQKDGRLLPDGLIDGLYLTEEELGHAWANDEDHALIEDNLIAERRTVDRLRNVVAELSNELCVDAIQGDLIHDND